LNAPLFMFFCLCSNPRKDFIRVYGDISVRSSTEEVVSS
jgi:hypothetical protein